MKNLFWTSEDDGHMLFGNVGNNLRVSDIFKRVVILDYTAVRTSELE